MTRPFSVPGSAQLVGSVALVAVGVAVNTGLNSPYRMVPALLLLAAGVAGVATAARDYSPDRLRLATGRWWTLAFVAFLPYGLVMAPGNDSAAAVADVLAGPVAAIVLESIAGAVICCAVAITILYGFATYGIHPGRPTPEERVLED
ncbi:DUF1467 domain-containing protein [Halosolutus amylolyticus]|uniref:DUF1467 domain-containing protein n=1 Tax=Halosolutus amylolyticus TaxID=2932267 RepID=A0ABD5PTB6_9EURY|nr:DUF1467 domain-containing protein [Halosolutus amylolyticus]